MTKYLFPEELRKFGFVPIGEWQYDPQFWAEDVAIMYVTGKFTTMANCDIERRAKSWEIIAVQVAPVPCEKVKVWSWSRDSIGQLLIRRNTGFWRSIEGDRTDAQAQELCDLLERQEGV